MSSPLPPPPISSTGSGAIIVLCTVQPVLSSWAWASALQFTTIRSVTRWRDEPAAVQVSAGAESHPCSEIYDCVDGSVSQRPAEGTGGIFAIKLLVVYVGKRPFTCTSSASHTCGATDIFLYPGEQSDLKVNIEYRKNANGWMLARVLPIRIRL